MGRREQTSRDVAAGQRTRMRSSEEEPSLEQAPAGEDSVQATLLIHPETCDILGIHLCFILLPMS